MAARPFPDAIRSTHFFWSRPASVKMTQQYYKTWTAMLELKEYAAERAKREREREREREQGQLKESNLVAE
jgi:hypothetical protein